MNGLFILGGHGMPCPYRNANLRKFYSPAGFLTFPQSGWTEAHPHGGALVPPCLKVTNRLVILGGHGRPCPYKKIVLAGVITLRGV